MYIASLACVANLGLRIVWLKLLTRADPGSTCGILAKASRYFIAAQLVSAMAIGADAAIMLPLSRTFFDVEDEDPFMYEQKDYEADMAVLGSTRKLPNPLDEAANVARNS